MKPVNDAIRRNSTEIKNLIKSLNLCKTCIINDWEMTISDPTKFDMRVILNHIIPFDYITAYRGSTAYDPMYVNKIYYTFDVYFGYDQKASRWNWFRYICPSLKFAKSFINDYSEFIKNNAEDKEGFLAFNIFKDKYIRLAKSHFKNWLLTVEDPNKFNK